MFIYVLHRVRDLTRNFSLEPKINRVFNCSSLIAKLERDIGSKVPNYWSILWKYFDNVKIFIIKEYKLCSYTLIYFGILLVHSPDMYQMIPCGMCGPLDPPWTNASNVMWFLHFLISILVPSALPLQHISPSQCRQKVLLILCLLYIYWIKYQLFFIQ